MRLSTTIFCTTVLFGWALGAGEIEALPAYQAAAQNQNAAEKQASPAVVAPSRPTEGKVTSGDHEPTADKIKRSEWVQIFISGFVALIVLWQAWMHNDQRKVTRIAERGYIGVKTGNVFNLEPGKVPIVELVFLNGGRTPLWNFYTPGGVTLDDEPPDDYQAPQPPDNEAGAFLVAGATGRVQWSLPRTLNSATIREVMEGRLKIYVKGVAWFEDAWGDVRNYPFYLVYDPRSGTLVQRKRFAEYMEYQLTKGGPTRKRRI